MKLKDLSLIAMMTALTAVMGAIPPIPIPISPIPITLQSIAPMLAGTILGARRGALSMMLLILLGACSLPVFSGGRGGVGVLLGPSGGFIFGWVLVAFFYWAVCFKKEKPCKLEVNDDELFNRNRTFVCVWCYIHGINNCFFIPRCNDVKRIFLSLEI